MLDISHCTVHETSKTADGDLTSTNKNLNEKHITSDKKLTIKTTNFMSNEINKITFIYELKMPISLIMCRNCNKLKIKETTEIMQKH